MANVSAATQVPTAVRTMAIHKKAVRHFMVARSPRSCGADYASQLFRNSGGAVGLTTPAAHFKRTIFFVCEKPLVTIL